MEDRLVAVTAQGMMESQKGMIAWLTSRVNECATLVSDLEQNIEIARKNKWRMAPFKTQHDRALKRLLWYDKITKAVEAGFTLVPNFPCEVIAIRTNKELPMAKSTESTYSTRNVEDEKCSELSAGEGEYKSPSQSVSSSRWVEEKDGKKITHYTQEAVDLRDPEFPFTVAKPQLLTATQEAMAMRLFDEIAVFPETRRHYGDPVVLGRIIHRRNQFKICIATFLIGWYVNLRELE